VFKVTRITAQSHSLHQVVVTERLCLVGEADKIEQ